jgi:hypothetical protein
MVDFSVPEPVSYWPQTTAWLVLFFFVLSLTLIFSWCHWVKYKNNAYRRQAVKELDLVTQHGNVPQQISAIANIIKRVALVSFDRDQVAETFGVAWLAFLDQSCVGVQFSKGAGKHLLSGPYQKTVDATQEEINDLVVLTGKWIVKHRQGVSHA